MVNNSLRITPRNSLWCDLHWQVADGSVVSWIIINGAEKIFGPLLMDTQQRSVGIPFTVDDVLMIEVHDLPIEQIAEPIYVPPIPDQPCDGTRSKRRFVIESIIRAARRRKPESMTALRISPKPNAPLN